MTTATKYKTYPKYKPSEIEWLGNIPDRWEIKRLRFLNTGYFQYGANEEASDDNPENPRYIRITDIKDDGDLYEDTFRSLIPEIATQYLLEDGDILFARSGATVGKTFRYKPSWGKCCYAGYLIKMTPNQKQILSEFLYYFVQSNSYTQWKDSIFWQATIPNISAEKYKNFIVCFPDLEVQKDIVVFLDHETTKIDEVVKKKENLIKLFKEKRQALIARAISKGLDPQAELKPSSAQWLGDIPTGWKVKRFNYLMTNVIDKAIYFKENDFIVALENIESWTGRFISSEDQKMPEGDLKRFSKGNVLFGKLRPYLAKALIAEQNGLCVGEALVFKTNKLLLNKFLIYRILTEDFINYIDASTQGAKMPRADWDFIKTLQMAYPSIDEQLKIVNYIERETTKIDKMIAKIESQIEKLQEYRQAIITSAVTGKIMIT